eukprot:gene10815-biopygen7795
MPAPRPRHPRPKDAYSPRHARATFLFPQGGQDKNRKYRVFFSPSSASNARLEEREDIRAWGPLVPPAGGAGCLLSCSALHCFLPACLPPGRAYGTYSPPCIRRSVCP